MNLRTSKVYRLQVLQARRDVCKLISTPEYWDYDSEDLQV